MNAKEWLKDIMPVVEPWDEARFNARINDLAVTCMKEISVSVRRIATLKTKEARYGVPRRGKDTHQDTARDMLPAYRDPCNRWDAVARRLNEVKPDLNLRLGVPILLMLVRISDHDSKLIIAHVAEMLGYKYRDGFEEIITQVTEEQLAKIVEAEEEAKMFAALRGFIFGP